MTFFSFLFSISNLICTNSPEYSLFQGSSMSKIPELSLKGKAGFKKDSTNCTRIQRSHKLHQGLYENEWRNPPISYAFLLGKFRLEPLFSTLFFILLYFLQILLAFPSKWHITADGTTTVFLKWRFRNKFLSIFLAFIKEVF